MTKNIYGMAFWGFASSAGVVGNFHHNFKFTEMQKEKWKEEEQKLLSKGI